MKKDDDNKSIFAKNRTGKFLTARFATSLLFIMLLLPIVIAHQPHVIFNEGTYENPIAIENPEISQAFYSELNGDPEYYKIENSEDFDLYVNILAPDLPGSRTNFVVNILPLNLSLINNGNWESFYEEFAGDNYLRGNEFEQKVPAGNYYIIVSNTNNSGKYSLAVGKIESFPVSKIPEFIYQIYLMKTRFFEKNSFAIFQGLIGKSLLLILIIIAIIVLVVIRAIIKMNKRNKRKKEKEDEEEDDEESEEEEN